MKLVTSSFCHALTIVQFSPFWPACFLCSKPSSYTELCCSPHTENNVKLDHITPLFQFLHWLPIQQIIQYKINTLCYKCITGTVPSYLCDCLQLYTPSRTLRSASDTLSFQIPRTRLSAVGSRAFSVFGPSTWNDLPLPLRQKNSLDSFKSNLKTFLFPKLWTCHVFRSCVFIQSTFSGRLLLCTVRMPVLAGACVCV